MRRAQRERNPGHDTSSQRRNCGLALFAGAAAANSAAPAAATQTCVDVRIGNDRSSYLNCLNDNLKRQVEHEQGKPLPAAPYDAHSPSNQVGGYNLNAAQEQMGNSFGVSPHPQRPTEVFVSPVLGR